MTESTDVPSCVLRFLPAAFLATCSVLALASSSCRHQCDCSGEEERYWRVTRISLDDTFELELHGPADAPDANWSWSAWQITNDSAAIGGLAGSGSMTQEAGNPLLAWEHPQLWETLLADPAVISPAFDCTQQLHPNLGVTYLIAITAPSEPGSLEEWTYFDACIRTYSATLPETQEFVEFLNELSAEWRETMVREGYTFTF